MFVTLRGETYVLWRAVDQHGAELDVLLQKRRDKTAARSAQQLLRHETGKQTAKSIQSRNNFMVVALNDQISLFWDAIMLRNPSANGMPSTGSPARPA